MWRSVAADFDDYWLGLGKVFECSLRCSQPGDWNSEWRAADVRQTKAMAEFYAVGVATVFTANAQLDVLAGAAASLDGDLHELAYACLIDGRKRVLAHDLELLVGRQE